MSRTSRNPQLTSFFFLLLSQPIYTAWLFSSTSTVDNHSFAVSLALEGLHPVSLLTEVYNICCLNAGRYEMRKISKRHKMIPNLGYVFALSWSELAELPDAEAKFLAFWPVKQFKIVTELMRPGLQALAGTRDLLYWL